MLSGHQILVRPIITEKNTALNEVGKYTFEVLQTANKIEIKRAVEEVFSVQVTAVNINKRMVRDLGELTPPPDQRRAHRELVSRGAAMTEAAEELFASFRRGDILAAQRQQSAVSRSGQRFDAQAIKVGATTCAEGASLGASFGG